MAARPFPLHAVGRPAPWPLAASAFTLSLGGWLAAAAAAVPAAEPLADGFFGADEPVLAMHLAGLVLFPFAVAASSWHLLPVMFRNDLRSVRRLWASLPLMLGGVPLAAGIAIDSAPLAWTGAALVAAGLGLSLAELAGLVRRVPPGKTPVVSRAGVLLSAFHLLAALVLGAATFEAGGPEVLGVPYERMVLVHLTLAGLGWLTLLILTVGRVLAPMLALAPAPGQRRRPSTELAFTAVLWLLLAGLAAGLEELSLAGGLGCLLVLGRFGAQLVGVARAQRLGAIEGPLAHLLAGAVFLAEAAGLGLAGLLGAVDARRAAGAFAVLLLAGFAAGVVVGHVGKLLSHSARASWPPGPRPKQARLYPRALWGVEAAAFALAVQLLAAATAAGSAPVARAGAALALASAALALAGAAVTVRRAAAGLTAQRASTASAAR